MGRLFFVFAMSCAALVGTANAEVVRTREVVLHISDVLVPTEKKASGESYVVVSGMFPSSCYRWNRAEVAHPADDTHFIRLIATVTEGMCLTVMVPYTKEVSLGQLRTGEHTLRFISGDETYFERKLSVK